jgi:alginate O-acetyltransferase complex protein AlgI
VELAIPSPHWRLTLVDYIIARKIASANHPRIKRSLLIFSLVLNFTFLGVFKYFNFFVDSLSHQALSFGLKDVPVIVWRILLPPGISYYTFQEFAYIVDVYHGKQNPRIRSSTTPSSSASSHT